MEQGTSTKSCSNYEPPGWRSDYISSCSRSYSRFLYRSFCDDCLYQYCLYFGMSKIELIRTIWLSFYIYIYIYIYIIPKLSFLKKKYQSWEKFQLESKLDFTSVSFPYKLIWLDFFCYFFSDLMNIFFIPFLFKYFICKDIDCNWAQWFHLLILIQIRRYY